MRVEGEVHGVSYCGGTRIQVHALCGGIDDPLISFDSKQRVVIYDADADPVAEAEALLRQELRECVASGERYPRIQMIDEEGWEVGIFPDAHEPDVRWGPIAGTILAAASALRASLEPPQKAVEEMTTEEKATEIYERIKLVPAAKFIPPRQAWVVFAGKYVWPSGNGAPTEDQAWDAALYTVRQEALNERP